MEDNYWFADFSYDYFRKILLAVKKNFKLHFFSEAPQVLNSSEKKLFLRHDVDLDLNRALKMAEIEKELGVAATYMIMLNSPFYRPQDYDSVDILSRLIFLGHEIGLHFFNKEKTEVAIESIEPEIILACHQLENIVNIPIKSISFHCPSRQFLRGPLMVAGRVNSYAGQLMEGYLSDSRGRWREGEPLSVILNYDKTILQLLTHPIWWGQKHILAPDRLQLFFESAIFKKTKNNIAKFDADLKTHIGLSRKGIKEKIT